MAKLPSSSSKGGEENNKTSLLLKEAISKSIIQQQQQLEEEEEEEPLYDPSIFKYKCRGMFSATMDTAVAEEESNHPNGICRGIQSKLKHVRDYPRSNEKESIDVFLQAANYINNNNSSSSSDHTTTTNNHKKDDHLLHDRMESQAIIYDPKKKKPTIQKSVSTTHDNNRANNNNNAPPPQVQQQEEEEEEWNDWDAYGFTEVHVLVLRNVKTKEEKTVGLAPDCRLGVSMRDVGKENVGGESMTSIRVGPVEIKIVNQYEHRHTNNNDSSSSSLKQQQQQVGNNNNNSNHQQQQQYGKNNNNNNQTNNKTNEEGITFTKVYNKSGKIMNAMKMNAVMLRDAVSEDFPSRCWQASQRVTGQFGKTLDNTSKLAHDLYNIIWKDEDE